MTRSKQCDIAKYLKRNEGEHLPELVAFDHAVVIPAYDEELSLPECLKSLGTADINDKTAVIVVVNNPAGTSAEINLNLLNDLKKRVLPEPLKLFTIHAPNLKHGVGEARKIGFDIFCRSRNQGNVADSILFSLDADCTVDRKYFSLVLTEMKNNPAAGCAVIAVRHAVAEDADVEQAIRIYEKYLNDYENQLADAGSPYSFNAIGSGFAARVSDYIRCGGMKMKTAGEDFYFIQDISKCSELVKIKTPLVYPSPRRSERVPFGTGPAVRDIIAGKMPREVSKEAFSSLKLLLDIVKTPKNLCDADKFIALLPSDIAEFFISNSFAESWNKIIKNQKISGQPELEKAFNLWFDALQTRRFLHYMSEKK